MKIFQYSLLIDYKKSSLLRNICKIKKLNKKLFFWKTVKIFNKKKFKNFFYRLEAKFPNFHGKVKKILKNLIIVLN